MRRRIGSVIGILLITAMFLLGLTGCAGKNGHTEPEQPKQTTVAVEEKTTAEPEQPQQTTAAVEEQTTEEPETAAQEPEDADFVEEDGWYYDKEHVAAYIHQFGHLPGNYMTKSEARKLGWDGGGLDDYAEGRVIGGDRFGNREGLLPEKKGRTYYECDIDTGGRSQRGKKRIIYSDDGLIYYTDDHYASFSILYGEE